MNEEIWLTRLFNDHLAGLGNMLLGMARLAARLFTTVVFLRPRRTMAPEGPCWLWDQDENLRSWPAEAKRWRVGKSG